MAVTSTRSARTMLRLLPLPKPSTPGLHGVCNYLRSASQRAACPHVPSICLRLSCCSQHARGVQVAASSSQQAGTTTSPQTPLCERPADHLESLGEVLDWKALQSERIREVGNRFETEDGGPGRDELLASRAISNLACSSIGGWRFHQPELCAANCVFKGRHGVWCMVMAGCPLIQFFQFWYCRVPPCPAEGVGLGPGRRNAGQLLGMPDSCTWPGGQYTC